MNGVRKSMRGIQVIVAVGAQPKKLGRVPGFDRCIDFTQLLLGGDPGDRVVFFGGGQSSCEAAYELVLQGKHPVIVEYANDLIVSKGTCLANSSFLRDMLRFKEVPIYLKHSISEIGDGYVIVKPVDGGEPFKVECDSVVNGIGFAPKDDFTTDDKHVHRVGTCVAWGALREVVWSAWDVCMKI